MGVIKRGILGGFRGKVANVVGSSWKGIAVMKSLPLSVANPRTPGQVGQRNKFSGVVAIAVQMLANIIKPNWDRFAQQESGYNAFIKKNISNFSSNGVYNPALLLTSSGALVGVSLNAGILSANTSQFIGTLNMNIGIGNALPTDTIQLVVIERSTARVMSNATNFTRASLQPLTIEVGVLSESEICDVYFSVRRADGTLVSDSAQVTLNPVI